MTKEGVASYKASKAREAASKAAGTGYYKSHGGGGSSGGSVAKSVQYFYNPKTGHTTYRVGGGTPSGVGWQPISKPAGYVGGQSRGVATDVDKARAAAEQQDVEALKAKTTAKEKQVMKIEYALQQGMLSQKAAEKARTQQQQLMKDMPEKEPVETAFMIGGKTFVGTYGLKKVYAKPEPEEKTPAIFTGIPATKKDKKPTIPTRQKEWEETVDIITPSPVIYISNKKGILTEDKSINMWESAITSFVDKPTLKGAIPALMGAYGFKNIPKIRKELEIKEIEAERKEWLTGKKGMADVYGFGSAALYSLRTPESTGQIFTSFGKGAAVGVGITVLTMTTGPVVPAVLIYGGSIYGATQIPRLQEQIAESKFLGPVAYREKLSETGAHMAAAIGGAVIGSKLVPATISTYKDWHHKMLTSKGAAVEKGDYLWKEGYYSKTALKDWEKTIVKSKFISEAQKQVVLKEKGDSVWNKGYLEKGSGKVLITKQQDFLRQDFYHRLYVQDQMLRLRIDKLGLPSQAKQAQLGFERFNIESVARADLQLSPAAKVQAAMKSHQYLGKWITRPSLKPKADFGISQPKLSHPEQYTLIDATGGKFFESSYFKTGYYKPVPKLLLDYKPVGRVDIFSQWVSNVEYPSAPKVFAGKKGQLIHTDPSHIWEKGDIYTGLTPDKTVRIPTRPSIIEEPATRFGFGFTPFIFEGEREKEKEITVTRAGIISSPFAGEKPIIIQEPKPEIIFRFDQKILEPTKPKVEPILKITARTGHKQETTIIPFIDVPTVPDVIIPDTKIPDFVPEKEPPPLPPTPLPFGFGIPSITRTTKLRRGIKPRARPRPKRREITIDPFAGLYSVHVSEFAFGKATHPARTKEEKEKFKKRILGGAQIFPTVEMEKFRLGKLKL